jgi:hypothetical protein
MDFCDRELENEQAIEPDERVKCDMVVRLRDIHDIVGKRQRSIIWEFFDSDRVDLDIEPMPQSLLTLSLQFRIV